MKKIKYIVGISVVVIAVATVTAIMAPKVQINIDQESVKAESIKEKSFNDIDKYFYKVKDGNVTCYIIESNYAQSGGISCLK